MYTKQLTTAERIKQFPLLQKILKTAAYSRFRQYLPQKSLSYQDDRATIENLKPEVVRLEWPGEIEKPYIGIIRDFGDSARWTKYIRFLENNHLPYEVYDIHASDWIEKAKRFDVIIGIPANAPYHLDEMHRKTEMLEKHLDKFCYPSSDHIRLYDDKRLEAYIAQYFNLPFAPTFVSHDKEDALKLIEQLDYPLVSKIDGSSASIGVELIPDRKSAKKLVQQVFSPGGKKTHVNYYRQKNYIYLQQYIPNDGYDVRVIMVENCAFGYYRKVPHGDFRASGMDYVEKRELPADAIRTAKKLNNVIRSPQLVVDMVCDLNGQYHIIEYAPMCKMMTPVQLLVNDEPGVYWVNEDEEIRFEKGTFWVAELALRAALNQYLQKISFHQEQTNSRMAAN